MSENYMEQYGAQLVDAGYRIIPIMPGTKRPGRYDNGKWGELARWTEVTAQQVHIDIWGRWPGVGIGILLLEEEAAVGRERVDRVAGAEAGTD